jgi:hypothetical protein
MEHRKPKAASSKLDPEKQAAFIQRYETGAAVSMVKT